MGARYPLVMKWIGNRLCLHNTKNVSSTTEWFEMDSNFKMVYPCVNFILIRKIINYLKKIQSVGVVLVFHPNSTQESVL